MRNALILGLVGLVALAGCTLGPDYERPKLDLPRAAVSATKLDQSQYNAIAYWWKRYRDPVLDNLIDAALNDNLDIALQAARLRQARAQLGLAEANLFPSIEGQANATRQKSPGFGSGTASGTSSGAPTGGGVGTGGGGGTGGGSATGGAGGVNNGSGTRSSGGLGSGGGSSTTYNYFSVAATLSYELDVFGALRRAREAARAQLLNSAYTKDSIRLSVVSDVVTNYMSLRALQREIRVTKATIRARKKALELDQKRYQYGAVSKLPLLQTKSLLATARAQLPPLEQQAGGLRASLAVLTGKTARQILASVKLPPGSFADMYLPRNLPAVLPSALVNRRPDIRAAEASLIAANANVGQAKANFFPSFNLSANYGSQAFKVKDLFQPSAEAWSVSGAITAPILDFGRRQARYDTAKARKQAAIVQYRQTVRQAFREVHDALAAVHFTAQRVAAVQKQIDAYANTLDLAHLRYQAGRTSYFDVLDAQRQLYGSQLDLATAVRDRFTATADLFKALGGGWTRSSNSLTAAQRDTMDSYASPPASTTRSAAPSGTP